MIISINNTETIKKKKKQRNTWLLAFKSKSIIPFVGSNSISTL